MVMEVHNFTANQQIAANILMQNSSLADQDISSRSKGFIVAECITGFLTAGFATLIMEACRYFFSQPAVHAEFTAGIIDLKNALQEMAEPNGPHFTTHDITICGVDIQLFENSHNGQLYARVDQQTIALNLKAGQLADRLQRDIISHADLFGSERACGTFIKACDGAGLVERSLCMDAIKGGLPTIDEAMLSTLSLKMINHVAFGVLRLSFTEMSQVTKHISPLLEATRMNSTDALEVLSVLEDADESNNKNLRTVDIENIATYQSDAIKAQQKSVTAIRNMMADFISNEDTWTQDKNLRKPGENLLAVMVKHAGTLHDLTRDLSLLQQCDLKAFEEPLTLMVSALKSHFSFVISFKSSFISAMNNIQKASNTFSPKQQLLEALARAEKEISAGAKEAMVDVQAALTGIFGDHRNNQFELFSVGDNAKLKNKASDSNLQYNQSIGEDNESIFLNKNEPPKDKNTIIINEDKMKNEEVEDKDNFEHDFLIARNQSEKLFLQSEGYILSDEKTNANQRHADMIRTSVVSRISQRATNLVEIQEKTLDDLLKESHSDTSKAGYGQFMKRSLSHYFTFQSSVDQQAMLAASIRYAPAHANEISKMGALLKGAGPIMQKLLQGLNLNGVNHEFAEALRDMKCNLAPIPKRIVQAYLYDMVRKSNGEISKISVIKSLGAASVGEAFLCKIVANGLPSECVIKLLRPNVQVYAQRERHFFQSVANTIPGMAITFQGQMKRIIDELDLTKEASNIKKGAIYDGRANNLHSVELHQTLMPSANILILKKAPGESINNYLSQSEAHIASLPNIVIQNRKPSPEQINDIKENLTILTTIYKEAIDMRDALANLVSAWVTEGVYGQGFFHGDLHTGNIMLSPKEGATIIDYGNATTLTNDQQSNITLLIGGSATKNAPLFIKGFQNLLSPEGKLAFEGLHEKISAQFTTILEKGTLADTGKRIAVCLTAAQSLGIEIPAPIFNFSQCQMRLEASMDAMNTHLDTISDAINMRIQLLGETTFVNKETNVRGINAEQFDINWAIDQCKQNSGVCSDGILLAHQKISDLDRMPQNANDIVTDDVTTEKIRQEAENDIIICESELKKNQAKLGILEFLKPLFETFGSCIRNTTTFESCMGAVLKENTMASLNRIGFLTSIKLGSKAL